ncbi:type I restriction endonuclease subunit R [Sedimentitalea todarodis]|uniref:DEAD/DEAH box helicase family protein n=1 Tax=Sedimentitalea todarodis TaxID=1631240 RepID=A0ABU3VB89_9RHOB|nr:type I restriction endonuclease [Sedimentitalea todarodis]MDU9003438.1 DEAD/DEAH box helicase family protein [Sedimentitalea todarodis]
MTTHTAQSAHKEFVVQQHLIDKLINGEGYVERDPATHYDRKRAIDTGLLVQFLQSTQPDEWAKLVAHYATSAEDTLFKQLEKELKARGALDVMRNGIKIVPGIKFALCYFRPASALSPQRVAEYKANILSVMKEVEYSEKHGNRLDIALFVNGLPIATMEAKNTLTGTTFKHAEKQYKADRSPAGEPLLTFKRGALVHFAFDEDNVSMTTRLANGKTRFLPFNRGRDGGAGNPDVAGEFRVAYLYHSGDWGKAIFSREVVLDIIGRFMHLERNGKQDVLIFPRFQQLSAVRKCIAHAGAYGTGHNYLIQHSAGSGKSNTIGWLAHQTINLHDSADEAVFNTAIIVTDRIVLDRQLQATVSQFEQVAGVVKKIDGTSNQLKEAIEKGARIIITTIQKFSTEHLEAISGQGKRKFAVIIDEAHSSQSGKAAQSMSQALTREADSSDDVEDIIAAYQKSRGPQPNISFFAFTATPKNTTMQRFGSVGAGGLPHPFHTYSMRQAIEEGFILDVLQNYMTYKAYYELEKAIDDDPTLSGRKGQRKVARYASLHPTAIGQKVEVIVEHFRRHVMKELNGQAKAMIVTQSREHAVRYFLGLKKYIEDQGYNDLRALVAFSGSLDVDGVTYTEPDLTGFAESELPNRLDGVKKDGTPYPEQYQILIVAEKYQTGFDQPKLCAMYVDKKLAGLQAVQTLSRLNRIRPHKQTFVLDFQNTIEDIQTAFRPYFEVTSLEAMTDPNQVYELESRLMTFGYLDKQEVERFATTFFKGALTGADRAALQGLVKQTIARFEVDDDEGRQEEFRQLCRSYLRFYTFIAQVMNLGDTDLEKLHGYLAWLVRMLPDREVPPEIEVTDDMLSLQKFKIEEKERGNAALSPGDHEALKAIEEFGAKPYTEDEQKELSEIVKAFNERHGTTFSEADMIRFEQVNLDIMTEDLTEMLKNNPPDVVFNAYSQAFFASAVRMFQRETEMRNIIMTDQEARDKAIRHFFNRAMREAREDSAA